MTPSALHRLSVFTGTWHRCPWGNDASICGAQGKGVGGGGSGCRWRGDEKCGMENIPWHRKDNKQTLGFFRWLGFAGNAFSVFADSTASCGHMPVLSQVSEINMRKGANAIIKLLASLVLTSFQLCYQGQRQRQMSLYACLAKVF